MPARRFFVMRKQMFEIQREKENSFLAELCNIGVMAKADIQYYKELKAFYVEQSRPVGEVKKLNSRVFDSNNKNDMDKVDMFLTATFKKKAQLEGITVDG